MAGATAEGRLELRLPPRFGLTYSMATACDEPDIRRLLSTIDMDGWARLAMTREPDAYAAHRALDHFGAFMISRDERTGEAVGVCEYVVGRMFLNGVAADVPYLGSLRVAPARRKRLFLLRQGFEMARRLQLARADPGFALTSIARDNRRAIRLLTAGLPGMPDYRAIGELLTLAFATTGRASLPNPPRPARAADLPALVGRLDRHGRARQFAPVWNPALQNVIARGSLALSDFRVIERGDDLAGTIAVWDQRAFKQLRVTGYAPWLSRLRPLANLAALGTGHPRLPKPGEMLRQVYLSHFTFDREDVGLALIGSALELARARGADVALLGIEPDHSLLPAIARRFKFRSYPTALYVVSWNGGGPPALEGGRPIAPEIAVL